MGRATAAREPVAVIDIGSNSGRVIVYEHEVGGHLRILAGHRASLRLVRELEEGEALTEEAQERAFEALRDFRSVALRDASNGEAFLRRVRQELGIDIRLLSGLEEARYGFLGAVAGLPVENGVQFDLGGGSLQIARFHGRRLLGAASVPLGALRVSDTHLRSDPPTAADVRRVRELARETLAEAGMLPLAVGDTLVGTGGTLRNLARVEQRASGYPINRLHGFTLSRRRLHDVTSRLLRVRQKKRGRTAGLNQDRRDSIVGGGLVIETLMEVLGAEEVLVSGQGVREGLALSLATDTLGPTESVRWESLQALAARFAGWSADRARRREDAAGRLHAALERWPSPELAEAVRQAAWILDIGRTVDFFDRHEHVADLVLETDLGGFTHRQVALLSAILRRAGDEDAKPRSYSPLIVRADQPGIERAAVVVALADEITERCPPGSPSDLTCRLRGDEAVVVVPALESWSVRNLPERFERAFDHRLQLATRGPRRGSRSRRARRR
jgi:exopolyphosphatase/guanosine-5'-triphosphate,3'-diphosphate pyrophosphatase